METTLKYNTRTTHKSIQPKFEGLQFWQVYSMIALSKSYSLMSMMHE